MTMGRGRLGRYLAVALLLAATTAVPLVYAQEAKDLTGVVLTLDGGDVIVDLGAKQGISDGDMLELWRPLKVKHPVTGKLVTDRFRTGSLKVTQAREVMSLARPVGTVTRPIEVGDVVILPASKALPLGPAKPAAPTKPVAPAKPAAPTKPPPAGAATAPPPPPPVIIDADPEARALAAFFDTLSGTEPEFRAKAYEQWVRDNAKSRFAGVMQEEAIALRRAATTVGKAPVAAAVAPEPETPVAAAWNRIEEAREDNAFTFAVQLIGPIKGAVMQLRAQDEPAFTPYPLTHTGKGFWSVTIPKERVRGQMLAWFVEAITTTNKSVPVVGTIGSPNNTKVVTAPEAETPLKHQSFASLWTDYANYNRAKNNDYAWQTEGLFGIRFGDVGIRAVRSGFGVFRGLGGSLKDLDEANLPGRKVGLSYGYLEGEFGIDPFWAIIARVAIGLDREEIVGGGQGFLRIGNDKKTNIMIGGEVLGGVGLRGITQIELAIFPKIPLLIRSEVTNQPAGSAPRKAAVDPVVSEGAGDLGVRMIGQAGYRFTQNFVLFLRFSYQGRTINHAGPGVGAGASFTW